MILSSKGNFKPAPEGMHDAVCCDVVDLGIKSTPFGDKHKLRVCFQIAETDPETKKRYYIARQFTASIHPKSGFAKFLQQWRGKALTREELEAFDTEKLIGVNARIVVSHEEREGEVYANIQAIMKLPKESKKMTVDKDYKRVKDRPDYKPPTAAKEPARETEGEYEPPSDEAPF